MKRKKSKKQTRFLTHQWAAFSQAMNLLSHHVFGFLVLIIFVSILLSLPLTMLYLSHSISDLENAINKNAQISVYLQPHLSDSNTQAMLDNLKLRDDIIFINYISPEEGMKDFETQSGLDKLTNYLQDNPLPGVVILQTMDTDTINNTVAAISQLAGVDNVAINSQWLDHSLGFIHSVQKSVLIATSIAFFLILVIIVMLLNLLLPESLMNTTPSTMVHMGIMLGIITGIGADFAVDYFSHFVHALLSQLAFLNLSPAQTNISLLSVLINQLLSWIVLVVAALIVRHYRILSCR
jgi:hypothetical protein